MKNSTKRKSPDDWPKLKKRDLVGTKAYRGLCHLCGKEYQHLWVHLQSHSDYPTETYVILSSLENFSKKKNFYSRCDICGKGFRSKAYLSMHILLHKEAEMPCEMCGKKYRTKYDEDRLQLTVNGKNLSFFSGCDWNDTCVFIQNIDLSFATFARNGSTRNTIWKCIVVFIAANDRFHVVRKIVVSDLRIVMLWNITWKKFIKNELYCRSE